MWAAWQSSENWTLVPCKCSKALSCCAVLLTLSSILEYKCCQHLVRQWEAHTRSSCSTPEYEGCGLQSEPTPHGVPLLLEETHTVVAQMYAYNRHFLECTRSKRGGKFELWNWKKLNFWKLLSSSVSLTLYCLNDFSDVLSGLEVILIYITLWY